MRSAEIHHHGLTLHPLTTSVVAARPDFDPWQRDEKIIHARQHGGGYMGQLHHAHLIREVCKPSDDLYYWDGPWGALSGSSGIAVVRDGNVIETFTLWVS